MRLTAVLSRQEQVGALIDNLKNIGYDRRDLIITDMNNEGDYREPNDRGSIVDLQTEREGFGEKEPYNETFDLKDINGGILVSLETSTKEVSKVMEIMEQSGATKIIRG
ncbi:hypothetical protein SAMN02746089_01101 [Caldanaerobius fijiensis DSM 17918]|uniref:Heat induced stress protein YflT n=1 Tax=Caldanaerobius fijiensis DSM 17918 TaxID=1121256 RepID=A0A1M4XXD4_9THEO|nr:hypothetical protein [Caldanaerobius fijiensis]SHE98217.1 hypothetical protein SAMN02746089_01101 [Caldanaerobius fijiensis DSM 17918]